MQTYESSDVLRRYRLELGENVKPLSRERELDLARRYRKGQTDAGEALVRACLPFVMSIAKEYRRWGTPMEDLVQQGNLGLLKAVEKFDPSKECRLATYAAYWIRAEIREYVVRAYRVVRLGTTKGERTLLRLHRRTGETNPIALSQATGLSEERVKSLLPLITSREVRFGDVGSASEGQGIEAKLAAKGPSPEDEAAKGELAAQRTSAIRVALSHLPPREQLIVKARLMDDDPMTLEQIGVMLGVSKERVRQLEDRARTRLRDELLEYRQAG